MSDAHDSAARMIFTRAIVAAALLALASSGAAVRSLRASAAAQPRAQGTLPAQAGPGLRGRIFNVDPVWSPDGKKIVFESNRALDGSDALNTNGTFNVWVTNADGTGATPLTKIDSQQADSLRPMWSPDGKHIVFFSRRALDGSDAQTPRGQPFNVWEMNADGSGAHPLSQLMMAVEQGLDEAWAPNGRGLAFSSARKLDGSDETKLPGGWNIWLVRWMGTAGSADSATISPLTMVSNLAVQSADPAWSPDGRRMLFESSRALDGSDQVNFSLNKNIWVMNADGTAATPLTKISARGAASVAAVWSPDGRVIAFQSMRALDGGDAVGGGWNIWKMNADGSDAMPLTKLATGGAFAASWSPDKKKIVFVADSAFDANGARDPNPNEGGAHNIWVMNADGNNGRALTRLTTADADSGPAAWSPDGKRILFVSGRALDGGAASPENGADNIWIMNADGSKQTAVTKLRGSGPQTK